MYPCPTHPLIGIDPEIRFGRACLLGTRISVDDVLNWLGNGMSHADIMEDFPELSEESIQACLHYAASSEG
ncbi:DUF433 domain-containing protein [Hymenobacter sp. UYCo722]|uniref:DUF433 domain-containing protein n=1 Tax=Hymenobacter sp. UYCo722 TaxID=3156335 RepID=UPI003394A522